MANQRTLALIALSALTACCGYSGTSPDSCPNDPTAGLVICPTGKAASSIVRDYDCGSYIWRSDERSGAHWVVRGGVEACAFFMPHCDTTSPTGGLTVKTYWCAR